MLNLFKFSTLVCKNFAYFLIGLISLIGITIFTFLSLPIYLYRWIVCQVLAPLWKGDDLGKAVTVFSSGFAGELTNSESHKRPRGAIVVTACLEGNLSFEDVRNIINQGWIVNPAKTMGKYPELQQFVGSWMGYLFWKPDPDFHLKNHFAHHTCGNDWTVDKYEQFACSIVEDLLNKPFPKGRSPWEVHVVNGYRENDSSKIGMMTLAVFRFHHCIADGFGILSTICEGLFGMKLTDCSIATPDKPGKKKLEAPSNESFRGRRSNSKCLTKAMKKIVNFASLPIRIIRDVGYVVSLLIPTRTPWLIPEEKRTGRQMFSRSGNIPISKVKFVKNKFGVSFTAVLLSSVAAGIAKSFKLKGVPNHIKNKLRNHATATLYELPIDQTLSPLQRLKESEEQLRTAKQSTFPFLCLYFLKLFAAHLPFAAKVLATNRSLATALTSFPGPGVKLVAHGMTVVSTDFAVGLQMGVGG